MEGLNIEMMGSRTTYTESLVLECELRTDGEEVTL
jgi:hypothetical protein